MLADVYLAHGVEECIKSAQNGGVIVYFRKEGRALGEVTKFLVYNARKRQEGGDRAEQYFARTECIAGVQDMRFQTLMPDVPPDMESRDAIVVDPMLATGHSAIAAVDRVQETKPRSTKFVCLVASRDGIQAFHDHHLEVPIYTAAVDDKLNEKGYILPGLGDAGDRLYGTR